MYKEIGSNFWLNRYKDLEERKINLDYLNINIVDKVFLSSGRNAILFILEHINISKIIKLLYYHHSLVIV